MPSLMQMMREVHAAVTQGGAHDHVYVARTDLELSDDVLSFVEQHGYWEAPPTGNSDGRVRVQAVVVCRVCGQPRPL